MYSCTSEIPEGDAGLELGLALFFNIGNYNYHMYIENKYVSVSCMHHYNHVMGGHLPLLGTHQLPNSIRSRSECIAVEDSSLDFCGATDSERTSRKRMQTNCDSSQSLAPLSPKTLVAIIPRILSSCHRNEILVRLVDFSDPGRSNFRKVRSGTPEYERSSIVSIGLLLSK